MMFSFQHNNVEVPFPSTLHQQDQSNPDHRKPAGRKRPLNNLHLEKDQVIMDHDVDKEKRKKKMKHREIERKRRQDMANLCSSLRSLLPLHFIKGKRSMSEHVNQTVNYIKHMEENIKELDTKRDELKKRNSLVTDSRVVQKKSIKNKEMDKCKPNQITVTVSSSHGAIEILIKSCTKNEGFQISRVLKALVQEGVDIISCNSTKVNDRLLIHSIHSKVIDETTGIQASMLQQKLTDLVKNIS